MTKPEFRVKRIYEQAEQSDGARVLVDRIWPRGFTRDRAAIDHWMKDLGPSGDLRKWFGHRQERWDEFVSRYHAELHDEDLHARLTELLELAKARGRVTLLYSARDTERNQAVALQSFLTTLI